MNPIKFVDTFINRITMYRLLAYGLGGLLLIALIFSFTGLISISAPALLLSVVVILTVTFLADRLFPIVFDAVANKDSSLITALILCFIMPPSSQPYHLALLGLTGMIAVGSKYLLAINKKHPFNPAAFAAVVMGLTSLEPATWWIGTPILLPFTLILGVVMLRKIRKFHMFGAFLLASLVVAIGVGLLNGLPFADILKTAIASSPLIFLGTIMLTEPSTTPPRLMQQYLYGGIVGALFTSQLHLGIVSATPELSLLIGNVYAYIVGTKFKFHLTFKEKKQLSPQIYDFTFSGAQHLNFRPGQYLEWTLPVTKNDSRGNRRTFSIASAPLEDDIHIAIRVGDSNSAFKKALMEFRPGQTIMAGQLAGDFTLPTDHKQKIVLIAGGIGVTPFVSMAKSLIKSKETRDVTLFYLVGGVQDYCYADLWSEASQFGFHVIPVLTSATDQPKEWNGIVGKLTTDVIIEKLPDYKERRYYISGPPGLVDSYRTTLQSLSIKRRNIITDFFSGY